MGYQVGNPRLKRCYRSFNQLFDLFSGKALRHAPFLILPPSCAIPLQKGLSRERQPRVIEPQDVITRDNVSVKVDAVLYFRVIDPMRAVLEVENFMYATSQVALTTLRSTLGQAELDELLTERDKVNHRLQAIIDGHTEPWGIKVSVVEVKDVDLPDAMKRSMAAQAEAERGRRAKVINAEGEFQASDQTPASRRDHDALSDGDADARTSRHSRKWPPIRIPPSSSRCRSNCWRRS